VSPPDHPRTFHASADESLSFVCELAEVVAAAEHVLWRTVGAQLRAGVPAGELAGALEISRATLYRRVRAHAERNGSA
jgi:transcriptional regulator of acetoin/glycerol metabolism